MACLSGTLLHLLHTSVVEPELLVLSFVWQEKDFTTQWRASWVVDHETLRSAPLQLLFESHPTRIMGAIMMSRESVLYYDTVYVEWHAPSVVGPF